MGTPNVIRLKPEQDIPEGYTPITMQAGIFAVKPKSYCKTCNGSGNMTVRLDGAPIVRHCNCMARALQVFLSPTRPGGSGPGKAPPKKAASQRPEGTPNPNKKLKAEIARVEALALEQQKDIDSITDELGQAQDEGEDAAEALGNQLKVFRGQRKQVADNEALAVEKIRRLREEIKEQQADGELLDAAIARTGQELDEQRAASASRQVAIHKRLTKASNGGKRRHTLAQLAKYQARLAKREGPPVKPATESEATT